MPSLVRQALLVAVAALFALPSLAFAQDDEHPKQPRTAPRTDSPIVEKGPCFDAAATFLPDGNGHNHDDVKQHDFSCGFKESSFDPLTEALKARPDVMLGESDVKNDIAAVAVAYPESGLLIFDVKDPSKPKFLSWYRGGDCDIVVFDTDCGAYVSLSDDGKVAFLSIQAASPLGNGAFNGASPSTQPGVQVIDLENPSMPILTDFLPVAGVNGVHTSNYHEIKTGPAAGEYLFMTQNSVGIGVARITRSGGAARLTQVGVINVDEVHDTFIQEDPVDNATYMYIAAGFSSGFYVYDVTNPLAPTLKAEWDLTPNCPDDWYSHTIDVAIRNGHRYVTMPTEGFYFGASGGEDCGVESGNGDRPGVMWIVDATDLSKLGPADASDGTNEPTAAELEANSKKALVATWHNAANAHAGDLMFSPHNQQIVGDKIYLSGYHSGVTVLNAKAAFSGRNERPYEEAMVIPHSGARPVFKPAQTAKTGAFISRFFSGHPSIWDMNYYKGYVLAYDEHGGAYSFKEDPSAAPNSADGSPKAGASCADKLAPTVSGTKAKLTRRGVKVTGRARDVSCGGRAGSVSRVSVAIALKSGKRCRFLGPKGRLIAARSCAKPVFAVAKGTAKFAYASKAKLPKGRYVVMVQAADSAGNLSKAKPRAAKVG